MKLREIIDTLKKQTASNKEELRETFNYFMTHIAEGPAAQAESKPFKKIKIYKKMIKEVLKRSQMDITVHALLLMRINKHNFIHGSGFASKNKLIGFYYFTDINLGMFMLSPMDGQGECNFFRINAFIIENPSEAIRPSVTES